MTTVALVTAVAFLSYLHATVTTMEAEPSTKRCSKCRTTKPLTEFPNRAGRKDGKYAWCTSCNREHAAAWRAKYPDRARAASRREGLRRRFGKEITPEVYDAMLAAQGGRCAVCGTSEPGHTPSRLYFDIDHDHETGAIRGLLCQACNMGIGQLGEDPERLRAAAAYLDSYR